MVFKRYVAITVGVSGSGFIQLESKVKQVVQLVESHLSLPDS